MLRLSLTCLVMIGKKMTEAAIPMTSACDLCHVWIHPEQIVQINMHQICPVCHEIMRDMEKTQSETDHIKALIEILNSWAGHDGSKDHADADDILLNALFLLGGQDVIDAYLALRKRCGAAWYA